MKHMYLVPTCVRSECLLLRARIALVTFTWRTGDAHEFSNGRTWASNEKRNRQTQPPKFTFVSFFFSDLGNVFLFEITTQISCAIYIFFICRFPARFAIFSRYSSATQSVSFCFVFGGNFSTHCLLYASE